MKHPNKVFVDLHYAWPEVSDRRDPHAGDEILALASRYENYVAYAPPPHLDEAAYEEAVLRFEAGTRAILDGLAPWSTLSALSVEVGVDGDVRHDRRGLAIAPLRIECIDLAEMIEDWAPDVGVFAPERVLGPFAEGRLPRALLAVAAATLALSPVLFPRTRPIDRALKARKPRPPAEVRASLRALARAPTSLWERRGDRWASLLPVAPQFLPDGAMEGPDAPFAVGRAIRGPEGWWLAAALPLPAVPPAAIVVRRMEMELLRLRVWERRTTWEDLLRDRGEVVARTCCEWCDLQGIDIR